MGKGVLRTALFFKFKSLADTVWQGVWPSFLRWWRQGSGPGAGVWRWPTLGFKGLALCSHKRCFESSRFICFDSYLDPSSFLICWFVLIHQSFLVVLFYLRAVRSDVINCLRSLVISVHNVIDISSAVRLFLLLFERMLKQNEVCSLNISFV